jgi:hypothetical protein
MSDSQRIDRHIGIPTSIKYIISCNEHSYSIAYALGLLLDWMVVPWAAEEMRTLAQGCMATSRSQIYADGKTTFQP